MRWSRQELWGWIVVYPERIFEHLQGEFLGALEECRDEPGKKAVHALRTSARRIEALLGAAQRRRLGDAKFGRQVDRALRALRPVRSAAGLVRDADVQRELLAEIVARKANPGDGLELEARTVDRRLKKARKVATADLVKVVERSEGRIVRRLSLLHAEFAASEWKSLLKDANQIEQRSRKDLNVHDPESLHDYRKDAKFARYLAEMEGESRAAGLFAKDAKRTLDAIGRWHDWLLLMKETRETLGKSATLARVMKDGRRRSLRKAIRSVDTLR